MEHAYNEIYAEVKRHTNELYDTGKYLTEEVNYLGVLNMRLTCIAMKKLAMKYNWKFNIKVLK